MGKVYAPPIECGNPPIFDVKKPVPELLAEYAAYEQRIVAWCRQHGSGPEAGRIVRFPIGDGQASYVIESLKPVILIHVPTPDSYQFPYIERLTAKDVRERIQQEESIAELFGRNSS